MSRNTSGVYTLPVAAYVANTVIKSADMNSNLSDIAFALTTSLATTGVSTMTGPVKLADGSAGSPSLTTATDTSTGWYKSSGTAEWTFVSSGVAQIVISASTFTVTPSSTFTGAMNASTTITAAGTITSNTLVTGPEVQANYLTLPVPLSVPATAPSSGARLYTQILNYAGTLTGSTPSLVTVDNFGNLSPISPQGGNCRLSLSGGSLLLQAYNGGTLTIQGSPRQLQASTMNGITLAASNTAATFVYIYAYVSNAALPASNISLEMSTVAPTYSNQVGMAYKSTDNTRTLVGAAYTDAGGAWADTDGKRWVISYFNRKPKTSKVALSGATVNVTASAITQEVSTSLRNQFICWSDEITRSQVFMSVNSATAGGPSYFFNRVDNLASTFSAFVQASLQTSTIPICVNMNISGVTENTVHFVSPTILGANNTVNVLASNATTTPTAGASYVIVEIQG